METFHVCALTLVSVLYSLQQTHFQVSMGLKPFFKIRLSSPSSFFLKPRWISTSVREGRNS